MRFLGFSAPALAAICLLAAVGCQAQQRKPTAMTDPTPPPTLVAPALAAPTPAPVANITPPPKPAPAPKVTAVAVTPGPAVPAGIPRAWVPTASANSWRWIVIHHSATPVGGAARFDREHRAKGWDELGYHFVIGNGSDTAAGQVEVGSRWPKQKWGAHAKTPSEEFNKYGIGICLVGNFDQSRPSDAQMRSLTKLVAYLMKTYHIPADHIIGHGDTKATDCPGRYLSVATARRLSVQALVANGDVPPVGPTRTAAAGTELLADRKAR